MKNDRKITQRPARPGDILEAGTLPDGGTYRLVVVDAPDTPTTGSVETADALPGIEIRLEIPPEVIRGHPRPINRAYAHLLGRDPESRYFAGTTRVWRGRSLRDALSAALDAVANARTSIETEMVDGDRPEPAWEAAIARSLSTVTVVEAVVDREEVDRLSPRNLGS